MYTTRREMMRQILGGTASIGMMSLAGCSQGAAASSFYVICHGMMLFEVCSAKKADPGSLVVHIPCVPKTMMDDGEIDPGHVYKAGSRGEGYSLIDLATSNQCSPQRRYTLELSRKSAPSTVDVPRATDVVLDRSCGACLKRDRPLVRVTMPLPDSYVGWRSSYAKTGTLLKSKVPGQSYMPGTVYQVHIFVYQNASHPVLKDDRKTAQWPAPGDMSNKLHIFAEPAKPAKMEADHSYHLHQLFDPSLDICISANSVCTYEAPLTGSLRNIHKRQLVELKESVPIISFGDYCTSVPACESTGIKFAAHPTNCKSYFLTS